MIYWLTRHFLLGAHTCMYEVRLPNKHYQICICLWTLVPSLCLNTCTGGDADSSRLFIDGTFYDVVLAAHFGLVVTIHVSTLVCSRVP